MVSLAAAHGSPGRDSWVQGLGLPMLKAFIWVLGPSGLVRVSNFDLRVLKGRGVVSIGL